MNPIPKEMSPILVVDDDAGQCSLLKAFLAAQGFSVLCASSGHDALTVLDAHPVSMVVSDVRMPGLSGLELLRMVRRDHPALPVLLVTAYADVRDAIGAVRDGAVDYLEKPIDLDGLLAAVGHALGISPESPTAYEEQPLPSGVVAESPCMQALLQKTAIVAASDARVLITGESGTGKEVVAEVIHQWSPRRARPLIRVNCAAIPEAMLESELFGHEKGAFTGATGQRVGRFEEADGGTILLDEIGELPPRAPGQAVAGDAGRLVPSPGLEPGVPDRCADCGGYEP